MSSENSEVLFHPTVADLIAALQRFPADASIQIIDADTGWRIRKFHVGHTSTNGFEEIPPENVYLWSSYDDMDHA